MTNEREASPPSTPSARGLGLAQKKAVYRTDTTVELWQLRRGHENPIAEQYDNRQV